MTTQDIRSLFKGDRVDRAEVVIGLVGAMGTDMDRITDALSAGLVSVAYRVQRVHVSLLIHDFFESEEVAIPTQPETKLDLLMDLGDALRKGLNHGGAAAVLAIGKIARNRRDDESDTERQGVATIVRQLKHPREVEVLRSIYGPRFVLVGVWAPESERMAAVEGRLRTEHPGQSDDWYAQQVKRLLVRDEKDVSRTLGQRVRDTYELADAFVATSPGHDSSEEAARLIRLLFGSPYETPKRHEQAMYISAGASLRSSDAGRQVGAVVVDEDGEILVTGVNEVPKPHGAQYWPGDVPDLRDFQLGYDENARQKLAIITDLLKSLAETGWLGRRYAERAPDELAREAIGDGGPLAKNRVGDLLEFARVAHAEMAAICTAARRGVPIRGQVMFTTTYPCHECARLIIAAGISRVVYVDPYPKSQVRAMYHREVTEDADDLDHKISFEPYHGIAPRLYRSVFRMTGRDRDAVSGDYEAWDPSTALPRLVAEAQVLNNVIETESSIYEAVFEELTETRWGPVFESLRG